VKVLPLYAADPSPVFVLSDSPGRYCAFRVVVTKVAP
jgi:hypothetical protein